MDGHTILYAATNGGQAGTSAGPAAGPLAPALTASGAVVRAGVYRYVVVTPKLTVKLSGLSGNTLRLHRYVVVKGAVTPKALAGTKVTLRLQRLVRTWVTVKTAQCTVGTGGSFTWWYKPASKGRYRLRGTITKTATRLAATTPWRGFTVR